MSRWAAKPNTDGDRLILYSESVLTHYCFAASGKPPVKSNSFWLVPQCEKEPWIEGLSLTRMDSKGKSGAMFINIPRKCIDDKA